MAATATKKPHSVSPQQPSNIQQIPSKSRSNTPCKAFIIVVLLLLIPLFPSQAPDFITQTHFTQFWEIIHLLFIGIAVSYGLFATRTAQTAPDKFVDSTLHDSHSYLSGISHLHSIFNDEQDELQNYSNCACECVLTRDDQLIGKGRCVIHGATKIRSFESNDGVENIHEGNGKTVNQAWCSQYSKGKSLVVVSNGKYFLDGSSDYKPLNLPIRSLRSRAVDDDGCELESRKTDPKIEANGNGVVKVRGVVPMNLEKKFEEAAGRSAIPWRSRSVRMRSEEEMSDLKPPAHSRIQSVGEFEFRHLKSRSLQGSKTRVEGAVRRRIFKHPHPKTAPVNVEASFNGSKTGPFSSDASSDIYRHGEFENNQKNFTEHSEEGKGKHTIELDVDEKSWGVGRVLSRAKSVRTIKPSKYIVNQKDGKLGRVFNNYEADSLGGRGEEPENPPSNHQEEEPDRIFAMPKPNPTLPEFHDEEKQHIEPRNATKPEKEREDESDKNSDEEDAKTNIENDSELEGSEVDRKAGEFIAKFREQIRLQKTSSIEGYSGW